jgi:hypothetical protein
MPSDTFVEVRSIRKLAGTLTTDLRFRVGCSPEGGGSCLAHFRLWPFSDSS